MVKYRSLARLCVVGLVFALSGCSSSSSTPTPTAPPATVAPAATTAPAPSPTPGGGGEVPTNCSNKIVNPSATIVTLWSWSSDQYVDAYNNAHTDLQVCLVNAGAAQAEYDKFNIAISAGTGAPDLIQIEYPWMNSYVAQKAIVDFKSLGIPASFFDQFLPAAVQDVSSGSGVFGVPWDGGPFVFFYREDMFAQAGIAGAPLTWDQYKQDAQLLHAKFPKSYIGAFETNQSMLEQALFQQAGSVPYDFDSASPDKLGVHLNDAASAKVLNFWQDLAKRGLVTTDDLFGTDYNTKLANGTLAGFIIPAWGHFVLAGAVGNAKQDWKVAMLPQWDSANPVQVNWGGSAFAVTAQSAKKEAAAKLASELYTSTDTLNTMKKINAISISKSLATDPGFLSQPDPFFGNQQANVIYLAAYAGYKGFTYSPIQAFAYDALSKQLVAMVRDGKSVDAALADLQAAVVAQAQTLGLTVTQ